MTRASDFMMCLHDNQQLYKGLKGIPDSFFGKIESIIGESCLYLRDVDVEAKFRGYKH